MEPVYTKEGDDYVFTLGDLRVNAGPEVAICFDKAASVLLKHGHPDRVTAYANQARQAYLNAGFIHGAEDLVVITGAFDLEELNKVVSICDYIGRFYQKLLAQPQPMKEAV